MKIIPNTTHRSIKRVRELLIVLILLILIVLVFLLVAYPRIVGGETFTVLSGSMRPSFQAGDVIAIKPIEPSEIKVGDAITFQLESGKPTVVTHRVVGFGSGLDGAKSFVTKGDANNVADVESVLPEQIRGKVMYSVPKVGYLTNGISLKAREVVVYVCSGLVILYGFILLIGPKPSRRSRTNKIKPVRAVTDSDDSTYPQNGQMNKQTVKIEKQKGGKHRIESKYVVSVITAAILAGTISTFSANNAYAEDKIEHRVAWSLDGTSWQNEERLEFPLKNRKIVPEQYLENTIWLKNLTDEQIVLDFDAVWNAWDTSDNAGSAVAANVVSEVLPSNSQPDGLDENPITLLPYEIRSFYVRTVLPQTKNSSLDSRNLALRFTLDVHLRPLLDSEPTPPKPTNKPTSNPTPEPTDSLPTVSPTTEPTKPTPTSDTQPTGPRKELPPSAQTPTEQPARLSQTGTSNILLLGVITIVVVVGGVIVQSQQNKKNKAKT